MTGPSAALGNSPTPIVALDVPTMTSARALVDRLERELGEAAAAVRAVGVEALPLVGDVADFAGTQALGRRILGTWGRADVLVNNAGVSQPKGLLDITEEEWDRTIAINLKGAFSWCKAIAPAMLTQRSVNMSSVSAHTGAGFGAVSKSAYCAAKAGVLGLTRGLAKELAPHVTVNAICPGLVQTALTAAMVGANRETLVRAVPLARLGTPEDIAEVVAFLATVMPNFITGEIVDVDGGQWIN